MWLIFLMLPPCAFPQLILSLPASDYCPSPQGSFVHSPKIIPNPRVSTGFCHHGLPQVADDTFKHAVQRLHKTLKLLTCPDRIHCHWSHFRNDPCSWALARKPSVIWTVSPNITDMHTVPALLMLREAESFIVTMFSQ